MNTFMGTLLGGLLTYLGGYIQYTRREKREAIKENKFLLSLMISLKAEIEVVWRVYGERINGEDLQDGFYAIFPITKDYFPVYHSNTEYVGKIEDTQLLSKLIYFHCVAQGLIDSFILNNQMVTEYNEAIYNDNSEKIEEIKLQIEDYGHELYEIHIQTENLIEQIAPLFENNIKCVEQEIKKIEYSIGWGGSIKAARNSIVNKFKPK